MELRHRRYVAAVADGLHARVAAKRLPVARASTSEQVSTRGEETGVPLVRRAQHRVSLTGATAVLLAEARSAGHQAEVARPPTARPRDRAAARLRIRSVATVLRAPVRRAQRRRLAATVNLETSVARACAGLAEAGRAEAMAVATVSLPVPTAGPRITTLGDQRAVAALPSAIARLRGGAPQAPCATRCTDRPWRLKPSRTSQPPVTTLTPNRRQATPER
jgi:DNA-binding transcriptional LysR family regulator